MEKEKSAEKILVKVVSAAILGERHIQDQRSQIFLKSMKLYRFSRILCHSITTLLFFNSRTR